MQFDLVQIQQRKEAINYLMDLIPKKIEITEVVETRSNQANRALHLYFTQISRALNEEGHTFMIDIKGIHYECPFTLEIVKNAIWKPIQLTLFDITTTKKLTTQIINTIIDVISLWLSEKGIMIEFPSIETLLNRLDFEEFNK